MSAGVHPTVHEHRCEDCGVAEPWPGEEHDAFCAWIGLCLACEGVHRNHCSCGGRADDDCTLQPAWVTST